MLIDKQILSTKMVEAKIPVLIGMNIGIFAQLKLQTKMFSRFFILCFR